MAEPETTATLVLRAQEGDRGALGTLLERSSTRLKAALRGAMSEKLRRKVEVDDLLQETFAWATTSIRRFQWRGEDSFYRWLRGIAGHMLLKAASKEERGLVLRLPERASHRDATPSKELRREERFDRLQDALDCLSTDHRTVVWLARIEGLAVKEIAARMKRSENAVMVLLSRALRKMRDYMADTASFHLPDRALQERRDDDALR